MVDDPKAGTPGTPAEGGEGAGTPKDEPKDSAGGAVAPDDKDARLTKLEADLAAEKDLRLKNLNKVEEANRIIEESRNRRADPATDKRTPAADPLSEVTEEDIAELQALAKSENKTERAVARAQLAGLRAAVVNHEAVVKSTVESAIARQPKEDQKAVRDAWESGRFRTVDDAAENVKLSKLSPLQQENEALKKRVEELSKSPGPAPPGTAGRGVGGGGGGGDGRKTITDAEYARTQSEGTDKEKWAQILAIRKGDLRVVSD